MIKIADIFVSNDGCGNYVLRLRGADSAYFTISNKQLYFRDDVGTSPRIYNAIVSLENLPNTATPISRSFSVDRRNCTTTTPPPTTTSTTTTTTTTTITTTTSTTTVAPGNTANFNLCADWDGQNGNVTTVGTNGGPSAYGTFDQGGNVLNWHDRDGLSGSSRGLRGSIWNTSSAGYLSSSYSYSDAPSFEYYYVGFRLASSFSTLNPLNLSNFVIVGDVNNSADTGGTVGNGSVGYNYAIGKYTVTNNEYVAFLNAVAVTDAYSLYNDNMANARGGITRSGFSGSYTYGVKTNYGNKPVIFVSWFDCARYCNWLHNGKPTGIQNSGTTEDGAYTLNGTVEGNAVARNVGAKYHIPTENEWYKAAYYKGGGTNAGYWRYATQSDSDPTCVSANSTGDGQP